jgi:hypothetical protein
MEISQDYLLKTRTSKQPIREIPGYEIIPFHSLKYPRSKQGLRLPPRIPPSLEHADRKRRNKASPDLPQPAARLSRRRHATLLHASTSASRAGPHAHRAHRLQARYVPRSSPSQAHRVVSIVPADQSAARQPVIAPCHTRRASQATTKLGRSGYAVSWAPRGFLSRAPASPANSRLAKKNRKKIIIWRWFSPPPLAGKLNARPNYLRGSEILATIQTYAESTFFWMDSSWMQSKWAPSPMRKLRPGKGSSPRRPHSG